MWRRQICWGIALLASCLLTPALAGAAEGERTPKPLKLQLFDPESPAPEFLKPAMNKGYQVDPVCEQACQDDYDACRCPYRDQCSSCVRDYHACLDECPMTCVDPLSVQETTQTQMLGFSSFGIYCFQFPGFNQPGESFEYRRYDYKHTTTRRTEYCNGTSSEEVVGITYSSGYCHYWLRYSCFNSLGPVPNPVCY